MLVSTPLRTLRFRWRSLQAASPWSWSAPEPSSPSGTTRAPSRGMTPAASSARPSGVVVGAESDFSATDMMEGPASGRTSTIRRTDGANPSRWTRTA